MARATNTSRPFTGLPDGTGVATRTAEEQLERLVDEMVDPGVCFEDARREFEKKFISQVLSKSDGNLCQAADVLGIHRNTLSRKMEPNKSASDRAPTRRS